MIQYPESFEQLEALVAGAIPEYEYYDGRPVCTPLATPDSFTVRGPDVDAAVACLQGAVDETVLGEASLNANKKWEALLATGAAADPIELGILWGWGTGHPSRLPTDPWYTAGLYGDFAFPADFRFLWLLYPFCSSEARMIWGAGRYPNVERPSFAVGLQNGRFYFQDKIETTISYD